jgi:hypothetical protein
LTAAAIRGGPDLQAPPGGERCSVSRSPPAPVTRTRGLWSRWFAATLAGETAGFAVPALVGAAAFGAGVSDALSLPLAVAAGAAEGAILGFAQSSVLRRELAGFDRRDWVAATAGAAAVAWAIGMSLGVYGSALPPVALAVAGVAGGAAILVSIGAAQALVLRRHLPRARRWVTANAAAWLAGLPVPFAVMTLVDEESAPAAVAAAGLAGGLGMAAVVAAVTGLALVRLLARPSPSPVPLQLQPEGSPR